VALLDRVTRLFDRPHVVVHDRMAGLGVPDRLSLSVGSVEDADDAVVGDR
jgi:hypothetical protein